MKRMQEEIENRLHIPWQVNAIVGTGILILSLGAFCFEVVTNKLGLWNMFFGLFSKDPSYIFWMTWLAWGISGYMSLQMFAMLFQDASGHYRWYNAVHASEKIQKEAAIGNVKGIFYQIWSHYNHGFPLVILILQHVADWCGFFTWQGYPSGALFLLAAVGDLLLAVLINYAAVFSLVQAVHMLNAAVIGRHRERNVYKMTNISIWPENRLQLSAGRTAPEQPMRTAPPQQQRSTARDFDPSNIVDAQYRDPSEQATQRQRPPTQAPQRPTGTKVPPIMDMPDLEFIRKK